MKKHKHLFLKTVAALTLLVMATTTTAAAGQEQQRDESEDIENQTENEQDLKNEAIEAARPTIRNLVNELDKISAEKKELEDRGMRQATELQTVEKKLDKTVNDLNETRKELKKAQTVHKELVVQAYMGGRGTGGILEQITGEYATKEQTTQLFQTAVKTSANKVKNLKEKEQTLKVQKNEQESLRNEQQAALNGTLEKLEPLKDKPKILQDAIVNTLFIAGSLFNSGTNPALTIMGPAELDEETLWRWYVSRGGTQNIRDLIGMYLEEGQRYGVRGDVAFVQAVLETGNFVYTGQHNYAGIGHCDSCPRGFPFRDARSGVRAQIQLLRAYADSDFRNDTGPDAIEAPLNVDTLGVRGCCNTWWGLTGIWATALHYGGTILTLYDQAKSMRVPAG